MSLSEIGLTEAVEHTRTGDLWLFRGSSLADRSIRVATNAPVNHVGMAVVLEDLPPLLWHAELGQSLPDVWTGTHHRGVQLHMLADAVQTWHDRYGQQAWMRQLQAEITPEMEDALLRTIARMDGTPFPSTTALASRWLKGRVRSEASLETAYCAELVAATLQQMGLLSSDRPENFYDPGSFWSGDDLQLLKGARLHPEVAVRVRSAGAEDRPGRDGSRRAEPREGGDRRREGPGRRCGALCRWWRRRRSTRRSGGLSAT